MKLGSPEFNFIPYSETERRSVDAIEFLRRSVEQRPSIGELPEAITIDSPVPFMPEAIAENGAAQSTMFETLCNLRALHDHHGKEFAATLVQEKGTGRFVQGPYVMGDEYSVQVISPIRQIERKSAGGLWIVESDKIVATCHSHPADDVFSLQDIYVQMGGGHDSNEHSYLSRANGGIDLIVRTQETDLFGRSSFEELLAQWKSVERVHGHEKDPVKSLQNRNAYILDIMIRTLKLGFYTNHGNEHSSILRRVVAGGE